MVDEAERQSADSNDCKGIVRDIVTAHGLGFNAWFCVCVDLANRAARRQGFASEVDRAYKAAQTEIEKRKVTI